METWVVHRIAHTPPHAAHVLGDTPPHLGIAILLRFHARFPERCNEGRHYFRLLDASYPFQTSSTVSTNAVSEASSHLFVVSERATTTRMDPAWELHGVASPSSFRWIVSDPTLC